MKTETFDIGQGADFLKALNGKRRSAKHAREARPGIPRAGRAAPGDGERIDALMRLAKAGYTCTHYDAASNTHWLTGAAGTTAPAPSYREMIDEALELCK